MNFFKDFKVVIQNQLKELSASGQLPEGLDLSRVTVEPPRDASHGDLATNAALVLAKQAKAPPRRIAALLVARLEAHGDVVAVDIAGPGFINLRLADRFWYARLTDILNAGTAFGAGDLGQGRRVNVEFVSANPTGPMHVGHCRGAVVGDVMASLLAKAGYDVTREYYINDAGAQVDMLARSVRIRYLIAAGALPEDAFDAAKAAGEVEYGGAYLIPVGAGLFARDGDQWVDADDAAWLPVFRQYASDAMMELIRGDLAELGVTHDVFTSERALVATGGVDAALGSLGDRGLIYRGVLEPPKGKTPDDWEAREQTLFRASDFGDDVDRPVQKSDGSWTYFATDMAYHRDKFDRGFPTMIDIWGADHGGYVKRMTAAVKALTGDQGTLDVKLCQMVSLLDGGKPMKMSKRAGTFVTLREVIERVGKDVVRFIMLTRKNDAQLEFDFAKVTEQSKDNPVFYVQYAHARVHSVLRHAGQQFPDIDRDPAALAAADMAKLTDPSEIALIRTMAAWPRIVDSAALAHEPHRLAFYLYDLASQFHVLWNKGKDQVDLRFLVADDPETTRARLALLRGVATVIASGLQVFGVEPVEEMR